MKALEFFQDSTGQLSNMRLNATLIVVAFVMVWVVTSLNAGNLQPIPEVMGWVVAAGFGGKATQRMFEEKKKPQ